jgi:hypothetical protein
LSPVATPDGSGFGASSARHGVDIPANNAMARRMAAQADTNDRRKEFLPVRFVMF